MASILCAQGALVLATAMAVSAGTAIILAIRLQKSQLPIDQILSSADEEEKKTEEKKKKKNKRVHFAEDVMDPKGNGEEFRRRQQNGSNNVNNSYVVVSSSNISSSLKLKKNRADHGTGVKEIKGMPANRVALYNGILRDRLVHRLTYSY